MDKLVDQHIMDFYNSEQMQQKRRLNEIATLNDTAMDIIRMIKKNPEAVSKSMNVDFELNSDGSILYVNASSLFMQAARIQKSQLNRIKCTLICEIEDVRKIIDICVFNETFGIDYELSIYNGAAYFVKKNPSMIEYLQYNLGMIRKTAMCVCPFIPVIGWGMLLFIFWYIIKYMFDGILKNVK